MVRIGDVWDSTTDVLAGRSGLLVPIAALAFVLPAAFQAAVDSYGGTAARGGLSFLVGLAGLVATVWGALAVTAVASDPATTRREAGRLATARLGKGLLVVLIVIGVVILLVLPVMVALAASGFDFRAAAATQQAGAPMPAMPPGTALFVSLYGLVLLGAALWAAARLFLLYVVVLVEERGIGAIGRSVQLTRGMTLKLIGVVLLFTIAYLVALAAVQSVVGLVARLALGPQNIATALFLAGLAGAVVTAAFTTLLQVFAARLYAVITGARARVPA